MVGDRAYYRAYDPLTRNFVMEGNEVVRISEKENYIMVQRPQHKLFLNIKKIVAVVKNDTIIL